MYEFGTKTQRLKNDRGKFGKQGKVEECSGSPKAKSIITNRE